MVAHPRHVVIAKPGRIWHPESMRVLYMILPFALAAPAVAQPALDADAFDRLTRGKTLFYSVEGQTYGAERYLDNQRVIWSFLDGECTEGTWFAVQDQICFEYENWDQTQCWSFTTSGDGLNARFRNDPENTLTYNARETGEEMVCLGPEVGV